MRETAHSFFASRSRRLPRPAFGCVFAMPPEIQDDNSAWRRGRQFVCKSCGWWRLGYTRALYFIDGRSSACRQIAKADHDNMCVLRRGRTVAPRRRRRDFHAGEVEQRRFAGRGVFRGGVYARSQGGKRAAAAGGLLARWRHDLYEEWHERAHPLPRVLRHLARRQRAEPESSLRQ